MKKAILAILMAGLMLAIVFGALPVNAANSTKKQAAPADEELTATTGVYILQVCCFLDYGGFLQPIRGVYLTLDGPVCRTGTTRVGVLGGCFTFTGLPEGEYDLKAPKCKETKERRVTIPDNDNYCSLVWDDPGDGISQPSPLSINRGALYEKLINHFPILARLFQPTAFNNLLNLR